MRLSDSDFPSICGFFEALHLQILVVRPFRVVQREAKASHYIFGRSLVFDAFPAFYPLIIRVLHFLHLADQICLFYNLLRDAPTGQDKL